VLASAIICVAVEGRFLHPDDVAGLHAAARRAVADGAAALFLSEGALGDPFVLAAALSVSVPDVLLGARVVSPPEGRHPTLLARETTSLDLVCGGRSVLCFIPPFGDDLAEAIALCRAMWRDGTATTQGPAFPVSGAANRPGPAGVDSPLVALDLTSSGGLVPPVSDGLADLLLFPTSDDAICRLERV
jgi:alkanesulfonate monooxygenase SsuD/methylene tetrahydromethanopterin reductase-like flavin-dependent oxidoreductase (luciferase family)